MRSKYSLLTRPGPSFGTRTGACHRSRSSPRADAHSPRAPGDTYRFSTPGGSGVHARTSCEALYRCGRSRRAPSALAPAGLRGAPGLCRSHRAGVGGTLPEHLRAPIDVDRGAGDRARPLGAQERHRKGEFVWAGLALDRVRVPRTLGAVLRGHAGVRLIVAYGVHEARVHIVDGDPILPEARGQRLRQRAQRTLRGGVRDARPATAIAVWAINVDDAAPARRDHPRHEGLRQVPGGRQLLIEEEVPVLMRGVKKSLVQAARRVADVDVHASEG